MAQCFYYDILRWQYIRDDSHCHNSALVRAFGTSVTLTRMRRLQSPSTSIVLAEPETSASPGQGQRQDAISNDTTTATTIQPAVASLYQQIQSLIDVRSQARWEANYETADTIKDQLHQLELPPGYQLILEDLPRSKGGGTQWKLQYDIMQNGDDLTVVAPSRPSCILQLAHRALGLAVSCSQRMAQDTEKKAQLRPIVQEAKQMLQDWKEISKILNERSDQYSMVTETTNNDSDDLSSERTRWRLVETTLRGRKAADAAFWFALAGVTDAGLLDLLHQVCVKELRRFGSKPTCRSKDILQIMDRFAAAGLQDAPELEAVARDCLQVKGFLEENIEDDTSSLSLLDLHSDRALLMLWKFSARQKKQQSFLQSAQKHWETSLNDNLEKEEDQQTDRHSSSLSASVATDNSVHWHNEFSDPTKPLILDVGCGMGISLLGLSTSNETDFSGCNLLGVDLSGLTIGYAQGMARRWNLSHRLQFKVDSAESALQDIIESYPGVVSLCMIQFPTPYQLHRDDKSGGGNSQLPTSAHNGFMVSTNLLKLIHKTLCLHGNLDGTLLLHSNCEDVAVFMRDAAVEHAGFVGVEVSFPAKEPEINELTQRTLNWLAGGAQCRAAGKYWSKSSFLPMKACTETEVACRLNHVPIHRCLLKARRPDC